MNVYLNHPEYSIIIPAEIFISIGKPSHVQFQLNSDKHIIAIVPANADTADSFDVPTSVYKGDLFALPNFDALACRLIVLHRKASPVFIRNIALQNATVNYTQDRQRASLR